MSDEVISNMNFILQRMTLNFYSGLQFIISISFPLLPLNPKTLYIIQVSIIRWVLWKYPGLSKKNMRHVIQLLIVSCRRLAITLSCPLLFSLHHTASMFSKNVFLLPGAAACNWVFSLRGNTLLASQEHPLGLSPSSSQAACRLEPGVQSRPLHCLPLQPLGLMFSCIAPHWSGPWRTSHRLLSPLYRALTMCHRAACVCTCP